MHLQNDWSGKRQRILRNSFYHIVLYWIEHWLKIFMIFKMKAIFYLEQYHWNSSKWGNRPAYQGGLWRQCGCIRHEIRTAWGDISSNQEKTWNGIWFDVESWFVVAIQAICFILDFTFSQNVNCKAKQRIHMWGGRKANWHEEERPR